MSYHYRGRYTHSYSEYQRWKSEGDAGELRRTNSSLRSEATRLRSELSTARDEIKTERNNVRQAARNQARLEEKQRELEAVQNAAARSQREFAARTTARQQELEREIRAVEQNAQQQVEELRRETYEQVAGVREEVEGLRQDLAEGLEEVRGELRETREHLEEQIGAVHQELEAERHRRLEKESTQAGQAAAVIEWVEQRMAELLDMNPLDLTIERTRVVQHVERAREVLRGHSPEMAMPVADTAFASYQTAYLEAERRLGVIDGVAEHVEELAAQIEQIAAGEHLRAVFKTEASQLDAAVAGLRAQVGRWRTGRAWGAFERERETAVETAHDLLTRALGLEAVVPTFIENLQAREQRLREAAGLIAEAMGRADKFETLYANPDDVKSPRLLRAHYGAACVDTYLDLEGTFRIDAYGFSTPGQCAEAADRMWRKLSKQWQVVEQQVDRNNRRTPIVEREAVAAEANSQRGASAELSRLSERLKK